MGKMRDGIVAAAKILATIAKEGEQVAQRLDKVETSVYAVLENVKGGNDVLYQYLVVKLQRAGTTFDACKAQPLSKHSDGEVTKLVQGVASSVADVARLLSNYNLISGQMLNECDRLNNTLNELERTLAGKRDKLFKSAKYKAKLATYDQALKELHAALEERRKGVAAIRPPLSQRNLDMMKLTMESTLQDVLDGTSTSLQKAVNDMQTAVAQGSWVKRRFRENGDLAAAHTQLNQWAQEAEDMEKEGTVAASVGPRKLVQITLYKGSTAVGKAAAAEFQANRAMEVPEVQWANGVDPLKLLQQKLTVKARYAGSGEGDFANDMRLDGVRGKVAKLAP